MPETPDKQYDILVAGAGFAGSLTALILHNLGFKVCLLEKGQHPRFAIGESSTPVADLIIRNLASKYNLPWLHDFSRYGSWQQSHPEIVCGIKRGFSFLSIIREKFLLQTKIIIMNCWLLRVLTIFNQTLIGLELILMLFSK